MPQEQSPINWQAQKNVIRIDSTETGNSFDVVIDIANARSYNQRFHRAKLPTIAMSNPTIAPTSIRPTPSLHLKSRKLSVTVRIYESGSNILIATFTPKVSLSGLSNLSIPSKFKRRLQQRAPTYFKIMSAAN